MALKLKIDELELQLIITEEIALTQEYIQKWTSAIVKAFDDIKIPSDHQFAILESLEFDLGIIQEPEEIIPKIKFQIQNSWHLFKTNITHRKDEYLDSQEFKQGFDLKVNLREMIFATTPINSFFHFPGNKIQQLDFPVNFFIKIWENHIHKSNFSSHQSLEILAFLDLPFSLIEKFKIWFEKLSPSNQRSLIRKVFANFQSQDYAAFKYEIWLEKIFLHYFNGDIIEVIESKNQSDFVTDIKKWVQWHYMNYPLSHDQMPEGQNLISSEIDEKGSLNEPVPVKSEIDWAKMKDVVFTEAQSRFIPFEKHVELWNQIRTLIGNKQDYVLPLIANILANSSQFESKLKMLKTLQWIGLKSIGYQNLTDFLAFISKNGNRSEVVYINHLIDQTKFNSTNAKNVQVVIQKYIREELIIFLNELKTALNKLTQGQKKKTLDNALSYQYLNNTIDQMIHSVKNGQTFNPVKFHPIPDQIIGKINPYLNYFKNHTFDKPLEVLFQIIQLSPSLKDWIREWSDWILLRLRLELDLNLQNEVHQTQYRENPLIPSNQESNTGNWEKESILYWEDHLKRSNESLQNKDDVLAFWEEWKSLLLPEINQLDELTLIMKQSEIWFNQWQGINALEREQFHEKINDDRIKYIFSTAIKIISEITQIIVAKGSQKMVFNSIVFDEQNQFWLNFFDILSESIQSVYASFNPLKNNIRIPSQILRKTGENIITRLLIIRENFKIDETGNKEIRTNDRIALGIGEWMDPFISLLSEVINNDEELVKFKTLKVSLVHVGTQPSQGVTQLSKIKRKSSDETSKSQIPIFEEIAIETDLDWIQNKLIQYHDLKDESDFDQTIKSTPKNWMEWISSLQPLSLTQWYAIEFLKRKWEKNAAEKEQKNLHLSKLFWWILSQTPQQSLGQMEKSINEYFEKINQSVIDWLSQKNENVIQQFKSEFETLISHLKHDLSSSEHVVNFLLNRYSSIDAKQRDIKDQIGQIIQPEDVKETTVASTTAQKVSHLFSHQIISIEFQEAIKYPEIWLSDIANDQSYETFSDTSALEIRKTLKTYLNDHQKQLWYKELRNKKGHTFYQLAQTLTNTEVVAWIKNSKVFQWELSENHLNEVIQFVQQEFGIAASFKAQQLLKFRLIITNKPLSKFELALIMAEEIHLKVNSMKIHQVQKILHLLKNIFSLTKTEFHRLQELFDVIWQNKEPHYAIINQYPESLNPEVVNLHLNLDWLLAFILDHPLIQPKEIQILITDELKLKNPLLDDIKLASLVQNELTHLYSKFMIKGTLKLSENIHESEWIKEQIIYILTNQKPLPIFHEVIKYNHVNISDIIDNLSEKIKEKISLNIKYLHPNLVARSEVILKPRRSTQSASKETPISEGQTETTPFIPTEKTWEAIARSNTHWRWITALEKKWEFINQNIKPSIGKIPILHHLFLQEVYEKHHLKKVLEIWLSRMLMLTFSEEINEQNELKLLIHSDLLSFQEIFSQEMELELMEIFQAFQLMFHENQIWVKDFNQHFNEIYDWLSTQGQIENRELLLIESIKLWIAELNTMLMVPQKPNQNESPKHLPFWIHRLNYLAKRSETEHPKEHDDWFESSNQLLTKSLAQQRYIRTHFWIQKESKMIEEWGIYKTEILKTLSQHLFSELPQRSVDIENWLFLWIKEPHKKLSNLLFDQLLEPLMRWSIEAGWSRDSNFEPIKTILQLLLSETSMGHFPGHLIDFLKIHEVELDFAESNKPERYFNQVLPRLDLNIQNLIGTEISQIDPEVSQKATGFIESIWKNKLQLEIQAQALLNTKSSVIFDQPINAGYIIKPSAPKKSENQRIKNDVNNGVRFRTQYCGLMLLAPFYGTLFKRLKLTENQQFLSEKEQVIAYQSILYITEIENDIPENEVQDLIVRIITGIPPESEIYLDRPLTSEEKTEIKNFIQAVKMQWPMLSGMSLRGFIESFLMRGGVAYLGNDGAWNIEVDGLGSDIILQTLPWGYATMKFPWNAYLIFTHWKIP